MEDNEEYGEIKNVILELAEEISSMTEGEKLLSLKKIVQTELRDNGNSFWTTISKNMLVNEILTNKILSDTSLIIS